MLMIDFDAAEKFRRTAQKRQAEFEKAGP